MSFKTVDKGRVYRYRDYVAFDTDETHTQYLSKDQARRMAGLLLKTADDIDARKSKASTLAPETF